MVAEVRMRREIECFPEAAFETGGAQIFTGKGLCGAFPRFVDELTGGGRVLLVADGDGIDLARTLGEEGKRAGLRMTVKGAAEACDAEENCLAVVGAGGAEAAAAAVAAARSRRAECVLFPSVPCEDGLLAEGGVKAVCLDEKVLSRAPKDAKAAAAGLLFALPVKRFEDVCAEKVFAPEGERRETTLLDCGSSATELAVNVLRSGADGRTYAPDVTAEVLRLLALSAGKRPRRRGEYVFVAACALAAFYKAYLSSPAIDTLLPADHDAALDEFARLTGGERGNILQAFDIFGASGYFRINYILGEYRMDLIAELASCDLGGAGRRWRRMYDDAGFWMKSAFTSEDVMHAMALAGEKTGGLLGFAAGTGFLAAMRAGGSRAERREDTVA